MEENYMETIKLVSERTGKSQNHRLDIVISAVTGSIASKRANYILDEMELPVSFSKMFNHYYKKNHAAAAASVRALMPSCTWTQLDKLTLF
jgi:hypothetical protein